MYRSLCIKTLSQFCVCICWSHRNNVKSSKFLPFNTFVMHRKNSLRGLPTVPNFWNFGIHWHKIMIHSGHFTVHRTHIRGLHSPCFLLFDAHVYGCVIHSLLEVLLYMVPRLAMLVRVVSVETDFCINGGGRGSCFHMYFDWKTSHTVGKSTKNMK